MKQLFTLCTVCLLVFSGIAQDKSSSVSHNGFYLSAGLGPAFGNIKGSDNFGNHLTIKGTAIGLDLQIGGALRQNLLLHATIGLKSIYGFNVNGFKADSKYSFDENFLGVGITKYTTQNFFVTVNAGVSGFTLSNEDNNNIFGSNDPSTDMGFSFNIKAGKEWAVGKKWGLGGVLFYSRTFLKNKYEDVTEKWSSNRAGVYFQVTFNKIKRS